MTEKDYFIATLWGECRGEPFIGQVAVACVIRNRVRDPRWPGTYRSVVTQPKQFSCWNSSIPHPTGTALEVLSLIADGIMDGTIPDITNGANHYINTYARPPEPDWARKIKNITLWPSPLLGVHTFYKL